MPDSSENKGKSRLSDPRNIVIAMLAVVVLAMGFFMFRGGLPQLPGKPASESGQGVSIVDVRYDDEAMNSVDIVFSEPVGKDVQGEVLGRDPAKISPAVSGVWKWTAPNILRFEASGGFRMATDYTITLIPDRVLPKGESFSGGTEFEIRTAEFQVEQSTVDEEPVTDRKNTIRLKGTIRFNYGVEPEVLARKIVLRETGGDGSENAVDIKLLTSYWSTSVEWQSAPIEKVGAERELELIILGDLMPADGNVPLGKDYVQKILIGSKDVLSVRDALPISELPKSSIKIKLSSPVSPDVAADFLSIEPEVDYRVTRDRNSLILKGGFKPGSSYKLKISSGLPALDDASLKENFEKEIKFPDLSQSVSFESPGMFLDPRGAKAVNVNTVNVKSIDLTIDRVYLNNLFFLFQSYGYTVWRDEYYEGSIGNYFGSRIYEKNDIKLDEKLNQKVTTELNLTQYIPRNETGLFQVGVVPEGQYQGVQKWILMTDIGIVAKKGRDDFMVWASSFRDLKPVQGAVVKLISAQNQTIAEGRTDEKGVFLFEGVRDVFKTNEPLMVTVEKDKDFSFLLLDKMAIDTTGLDITGASSSEKGYSAYIYGERNIYRPGETAEGVVIVREASLAVPEPMPVVLKHKDARGRVVRTLTGKLNEEGLLEYKFDIAGFAPTGNHTIEALAGESVIGQYTFQVEEFIPDRIKVRIDPAAENVESGKNLEYTVTGLYLFGPPASGLSIETRIDLVDKPFLPDDFKGYVFTNTDRNFDSKEIFVENGTLDDEGKMSFSTELPGRLRPPSSLQAQITARVQEPGGRGVTARRDVNVDPYPFYLGLRRKDAADYAEPGKEQIFQYVAVARKDDKVEQVSSGPLKAEFYRDEWNTVLRRTDSGNFKYESKRDSVLLDSVTIDSDGEGAGEFTFTPPEFGSYRVVLSDPEGGASTQVEFYSSGWGYSPWALENPASIEMDIEKDEYAPGDRAVVQVKAPFSGKLLITVERDDVYYYETYDMEGNTASVTVPVKDIYRPNAYVTATLVRPVTALETGSVARAFGAIPINVDRTNNKLDVEISSPEEIRPLTPLEIKVKTAPGAYITVAAVDEGILQLIDQKTPDPFTFFYRKLALLVSTYDTFSLLLPDLSVGKSDPGGGYAARKDMQFLSTQGIRRVKPVAFWSGLIRTDSEGVSSVSFDIPQFQGAVRVMAVAVRGKEFGSSQSYTRIKSPIVILPTVPRFISLNESVIIPVSVRNDTESGVEMTVNMSIDGPATVSAMDKNATESTVAVINAEVPKGSEKTVYFVVNSSGDTGALKFTVTASGNGESSVSEIEVPLEAGLPARRSETIGRITSSEMTLEVGNPDYYRDGTLSRELNISRLPLIQFSGKLEYLLRYPFGCLEQVTSSAFPLVYLSDIAKQTNPEIFDKADPASLVQAAMGRISSMQAAGGGFSLWPGGGSVEPWASIYAAHFLVEARKAGYFVEDSVYSGAIRFLKNEARARKEYSTGELLRTVYALYVLGRDGQPETSVMDVIRDRHLSELTVESRALLGGAYASAGDASAIEELLKGLQDVEQVERQTGGNFNSTIRNRAILLLAILEVNPDDPRVPELVERLSRDAETDNYWTTQESSFALLAIGQFIKKQLESPPYSGSVSIGEREAGEFTSGAVFNLPAITGSGPVRIVMDSGYSDGSAFFSLLTSGIPTPEGYAPVSDGLELERAYLTREGKPVDREMIVQGDLIVLKTRIRSTAGKLQNVVIQNLLPSGFEVENPRLKSTETLKWITGKSLNPNYMDIRDDRILLFTDLADAKWHNYYVLLRAVNPGSFAVPPAQAEAMYSPNIRFSGKIEPPMVVKIRE